MANSGGQGSITEVDRSDLERVIEHNQGEVRHRSEVGNQLGQATLKSLMLANGGAILSLLTFIGNKGDVTHPDLIKDAMLCFSFGLFTNLFAYFLAYFSQNAFLFYVSSIVNNGVIVLSGGTPENNPQKYLKFGGWALCATIVLALISLGCFVGGALTAVNGIL